MKELFLNTITKPPEVIVNKFLSSCFHAVKGKQLEPIPKYYLNGLT